VAVLELGLRDGQWMTRSTRLTAGAQYHVTPQGRDDDFWFFGLSLAILEW
jgi:hypothetical protein